jgi:arsenate reductase (thioredoxin)
MNDSVYHVLFLCTGNSARSLMAESILNRLGQGKFKAYSAGSQPKGAVYPCALEVLSDYRYNTAALRSKSWDEFTRPEALPLDLTMTLCDDATQEAFPIMPGHPVSAHWGFPDSAAVAASPAEQKQVFVNTLPSLTQRIATLVERHSSNRQALQQHLQAMEEE